MSNQIGFYVNQQACTGCKTCLMACIDKKDLKVSELPRRVSEISGGGYTEVGPAVYANVFAYWISISCNHCEDPACQKICPVQAISKRPQDGIVLVDRAKCIGCRSCSKACPYGAPQYDPESGKMGKCDLCVDLLAVGQNPACVDSCPMRALESGPLADLKRLHPDGTASLKGLPDPRITKPSILYKPHRHALTVQGKAPSGAIERG